MILSSLARRFSRTLFFPETRSDLMIKCSVQPSRDSKRREARCFVSIENRGPATVDGLIMSLDIDPRCISDIAAPRFWERRDESDYYRNYSYEIPINPGETAKSIHFVAFGSQIATLPLGFR